MYVGSPPRPNFDNSGIAPLPSSPVRPIFAPRNFVGPYSESGRYIGGPVFTRPTEPQPAANAPTANAPAADSEQHGSNMESSAGELAVANQLAGADSEQQKDDSGSSFWITGPLPAEGKPITNKALRAFRRDCTNATKILAQTKKDIRGMGKALEAIERKLEDAERRTTESFWKTHTVELIAKRAKTNVTILDGTGHMKREEDNEARRAAAKARYEEVQALKEAENLGG